MLAGDHAGQVASLEAQVSSLQDTVKLLAGHLQSLLNAPKTMTPIVMSPGPSTPLPPHAAAPVPGTAAIALMGDTGGVTGISSSYLADIPASSSAPPVPGLRILPPAYPMFERAKPGDESPSSSSSSSSSDEGDSSPSHSCRVCGGNHPEVDCPLS